MKNITPDTVPRRKHRAVYMIVGAVLLVLIGIAAGMLIQRSPTAVVSSVRYEEKIGDPDVGAKQLSDIQAALRVTAESILPSVVSVKIVDIVQTAVPNIRSPFDLFFGPRSSPPETQQQRQEGIGSGVIVRQDGEKVFVLSNNHVVGDAEQITLTLYDGREFTGELVAQDKNRDLAIIRFLSSEGVPVAQLGNSDELKVGDWVLAVGSPLGFSSTVTQGIVSALGRESIDSRNIANFTDYIQTDAAINPGNSGGALVNMDGKVVGINTWIASNSGGSIGLGFAVPINNIRLEEFISQGGLSYGYLGVIAGESVNSAGALVSSIVKGSPAEQQGLLPGDLITAVGDREITNPRELTTAVGTRMPDEKVTIHIERLGTADTVEVTLAKRPDDSTLNENSTAVWPGFSVTLISSEIRSRLGLSRNDGAIIISGVTEGSPADLAGLRTGDIIVSIGSSKIKDMNGFYRAFNSDEDGTGEILFTILRNGTRLRIGLIR